MPWVAVTDPNELAAARASLAGRGGTGGSAPGASTAAKLDARVAAARLARQQLNRVEQLYNTHLKGSGPIKSAMEYLPSQGNAEFDAAAEGLGPLAQAMTRVPGSGTTSDRDMDLLRQAYIPSHSSFDSANEERIRAMRRVVDSIDPPAAKAVAPRAAAPSRPMKGQVVDGHRFLGGDPANPASWSR